MSAAGSHCCLAPVSLSGTGQLFPAKFSLLLPRGAQAHPTSTADTKLGNPQNEKLCFTFTRQTVTVTAPQAMLRPKQRPRVLSVTVTYYHTCWAFHSRDLPDEHTECEPRAAGWQDSLTRLVSSLHATRAPPVAHFISEYFNLLKMRTFQGHTHYHA